MLITDAPPLSAPDGEALRFATVDRAMAHVHAMPDVRAEMLTVIHAPKGDDRHQPVLLDAKGRRVFVIAPEQPEDGEERAWTVYAVPPSMAEEMFLDDIARTLTALEQDGVTEEEMAQGRDDLDNYAKIIMLGLPADPRTATAYLQVRQKNAHIRQIAAAHTLAQLLRGLCIEGDARSAALAVGVDVEHVTAVLAADDHMFAQS